MAHRRFSQAISEGDGISVIAAVEDAAAARDAAAQRAEALVVSGDPHGIREASALPVLWRADVPLEQAAEVADAYLLEYESLEDDGDLEQRHRRAVDLGLDCVVVVQDEEELEQALERVDPEILLLSPRDPDDHEQAFACVLELLPDVPAGKLAIADLPRTTPEDIRELERAGVDAVIVQARDIASLAGGPPPEV
jgi:indole-3-glycerol phosphate synthase